MINDIPTFAPHSFTMGLPIFKSWILPLIVCMVLLSGTTAIGQTISVSHPSGTYDEAFYLTVSSDAQLRFTTDGNSPDFGSPILMDSIPIGFSYPSVKYSLIPTNNIIYSPKVWPNSEFGWRAPEKEFDRLSCIRIKAFDGRKNAVDSLTMVYRIGESEQILPIVSLVSDSSGMFGKESGIYVPGRKFDEKNPESTGNYFEKGRDWERLGHISYFDTTGEVAFSQYVGIRLHGGYTRQNPQKSIRIYARDEYGKERINYPLFGAEGPPSFKRVILRSGMTHWFQRNTVFQDELLHHLIGRHYPDIDYQRNQPVNVYLNGEFWGLSNMRERQDEYYLADHYDIEETDVEIVEPTWEGDDDFRELLEFCKLNKLEDDQNYQWVKSQIDLKNFIHYTLFELFIINQDWPQNNYKIWRSKKNGMPWKWMIYDFDGCLRNPDEKYIRQVMKSDTPHGVLFKSLSKNPDFVRQFLAEWEIMRDLLFNPMNLGEVLDQFFLQYNEAMPEQIARWRSPADMADWHENLNEMMYFLLERPTTFEEELKEVFAFEGSSGNTDFIPGDYWKIYPNPVLDYLNIETNITLQASWLAELSDMKGKVVVSKDIGQDRNIRIYLGHLTSGTYIMRLRSSEIQYSFIVWKANQGNE